MAAAVVGPLIAGGIKAVAANPRKAQMTAQQAAFVAQQVMKKADAKAVANSAAGKAMNAAVYKQAQNSVSGQPNLTNLIPTKKGGRMKYILFGVLVFVVLAVVGTLFWWSEQKESWRYKVAPQKVINVSRKEPATTGHREYMFKKRNNYMKEMSTTTGPGGQSAIELGGFFGMKAPGAILGQLPVGAPIKPSYSKGIKSSQTSPNQTKIAKGGVEIDPIMEMEYENDIENDEIIRKGKRELKSAHTNKIHQTNNTGHSEHIGELMANTTLASGNDFLSPFGQNSARYSNRSVTQRYIEPIVKHDIPNLH